MKRIKALILAALLVLTPTVGLAIDHVVDDFDDVGTDDFVGDDFSSVIPEPTGAVLMAIGLTTVGLALRRRRQ